MVKRIVLLAAAMIVAGVLVGNLGFEMPAEAQTPDAARTPSDQSSATGVAARSPEASRMLQRAEREGSIRAIVGLRTEFVPEGRLNRAETAGQRRGIENAGAGLRAELAGTGYRTLREYDTVPYIALELSPRAFRAVQNSRRVTTIQEDVAVPATLEESAPIVQAPTMWTNGLTGTGKTIAVLDTGVDTDHFFFHERVVEEACFSSSGHCPNSMTTQTGTGSGVPCTFLPERCEHGTHVAGIAAGNGNSAIFGVAPRANIMAVQVFSRGTGTTCTDAGLTTDPCAVTFSSDQIAGLEEVFEQAVEREDITVSAVNMSLGGGMNTSNCDTDARKAPIDNLRTISAATVISSGNLGFTGAVGAPACISSAITVGSTTNADGISSFSNMSSLVDLLAPGDGINSSIPGGGFEVKSGTSMAAPHVSGAWALMEQKDAGNDVSSIEQLLQMTGTPVTDNRAGGTVTKKRINIADAAKVRPPNDPFNLPREIVGSSASLSGLNWGINGAATREFGEPDHLPFAGSLGENSVWYSWTAPVSGRVSINTCTSSFDTVLAAYTGGTTFPSLTRVASDDDACDAPNTRGSRISFDAVAATTYRIAVAGFQADTRGEGTFTLSLGYAPPPNDDFANAQPINRVPASIAGRTVGATRETGEPDHLPPAGGIRGERSVWYRWTAPASDRVFLDTCKTNMDTVLAVYRGGSLGSLAQVASNKDGDGCAEGSRLSFNAVDGTTYSIAVAGRVSGIEGSFKLDLHTHPPATADYELFNSRESSVRGLFGVPPLADIGPGTNTFATATLDGDSRPVLKFPKANGLQLFPTSGLVSDNAYTIVALFEFDSVSGFKRILDFKNDTSDNGLYVQNGRLRFFPNAQQGTTPIPANTYVQVALTRNSAGTVTGYVNGVRQFTFTDNAGDAVIQNATLRFFKDNTSGAGTGEESAGSVARVRLYDFALTAGEVSALDRQDTIPPTVTSTDPANNATGVAPNAEVKATFSDPMNATSINTTSFKLRKAGTADAIPATVTYSAAFRLAFLNPSADLEPGATYIATVTSGARDIAGNRLDQDPFTAGNQDKSWRFRVSS